MKRIFWLALMFAAATTWANASAEEQPPFKILTKQKNDRVDVTVNKDGATFSVHSPFGISEATIERADATWPDAVVLRLNLKGLEGFRATNGKVTLQAEVSSQTGLARVWNDDDAKSALDSKSPHWMAIRTLGDDGKPTKSIPLKDGYFEVQLPKALFKDNPKTLTVNWIDFYRN